MKPTVITSSGNGSGNSSQNSGQSSGGHSMQQPPTNDPNNINNNGNTNRNQQQQFHPHFQGFNFDPEMDDMFSNTGIHSRLGRTPFDFGTRKRSDPSHYFDNDNDFFSNFGSLGRRRQPPQADRTSRFFDYIPSEFRQYMPDTFDFPSTTRNIPSSPRTMPSQQQHPSQYYESYVKPGPGSPSSSQPVQKPKLCDAAIQTENDPNETDQSRRVHEIQPLKQHGLRNTVDLGQISPPENKNVPRPQSAPPNDPKEFEFRQNPNKLSSTAYVYIPGPENQSQHSQERTTNPHQNFGTDPQSQYFQSASQPQQQHQEGGSFVRTVPIFVEGRSDPLINKQSYTPQTEPQPFNQKYENPQQNYPSSQQKFQQQTHQPYQPYQQYQQHQYENQNQQQPHPRPTPLNTQQANSAPSQQSPVPQTPQTTATIEKIQSIQRDVLDLMSKVEKFAGMKSDKEYMYLDEMLTRNLLKLDTIDTQGKERIRLARKEAIKCIEASINVLEAKAEENARKVGQSSIVMNENVQDIENSKTESGDIEIKSGEDNKPILDEASTAKLPDVVPLPPPPEKILVKLLEQSNENDIKMDSENFCKNESKEKITENENKEFEKKIIEKDEKLDTENNKVDEENIKPVGENIKAFEEKFNAEENKNDKQASSKKEERSKESPKKKIIKKIIKKIDKKDKKASSATPPSTDLEPSNTDASIDNPDIGAATSTTTAAETAASEVSK